MRIPLFRVFWHCIFNRCVVCPLLIRANITLSNNICHIACSNLWNFYIYIVDCVQLKLRVEYLIYCPILCHANQKNWKKKKRRCLVCVPTSKLTNINSKLLCVVINLVGFSTSFVFFYFFFHYFQKIKKKQLRRNSVGKSIYEICSKTACLLVFSYI